jgi:hypothetical protein
LASRRAHARSDGANSASATARPSANGASRRTPGGPFVSPASRIRRAGSLVRAVYT